MPLRTSVHQSFDNEWNKVGVIDLSSSGGPPHSEGHSEGTVPEYCVPVPREDLRQTPLPAERRLVSRASTRKAFNANWDEVGASVTEEEEEEAAVAVAVGGGAQQASAMPASFGTVAAAVLQAAATPPPTAPLPPSGPSSHGRPLTNPSTQTGRR